jgi:hypothetical protein
MTEKMLDEIAEKFLAQFAWKLGRDRQRADSWMAYQQDVLGSFPQQFAAIRAALTEARDLGRAEKDREADAKLAEASDALSEAQGVHIVRGLNQGGDIVAEERKALRGDAVLLRDDESDPDFDRICNDRVAGWKAGLCEFLAALDAREKENR